jgi:glycosyltransferase involved in cell wall biosynthesis
MGNPLFSILIANYNNGKFFQDCYNSIMAQTYSHWEVIKEDIL